MRPIALLALAGCVPSWVHDDFASSALAEARGNASAMHSCPLARVALRCDATYTSHARHGRLLVYDTGGTVGTLLESAPQWRFALDVCGYTHYYTRDSPYPQHRYRGFEEDSVICPFAACADTGSYCRSVASGRLWAATTAAPAGCAKAAIDRELGVFVEDAAVGIAVNATVDPLVLKIDGSWYAIFGDRRGDELAIGIVLGTGEHELTLYRAGAICKRSATAHANVRSASQTRRDILSAAFSPLR